MVDHMKPHVGLIDQILGLRKTGLSQPPDLHKRPIY
jgi:hypothetical protein